MGINDERLEIGEPVYYGELVDGFWFGIQTRRLGGLNSEPEAIHEFCIEHRLAYLGDPLVINTHDAEAVHKVSGAFPRRPLDSMLPEPISSVVALASGGVLGRTDEVAWRGVEDGEEEDAGRACGGAMWLDALPDMIRCEDMWVGALLVASSSAHGSFTNPDS